MATPRTRLKVEKYFIKEDRNAEGRKSCNLARGRWSEGNSCKNTGDFIEIKNEKKSPNRKLVFYRGKSRLLSVDRRSLEWVRI